MRIIAGEWRGRPIIAPKGAATRPTADRIREALFSMLASRLGTFEGLRVADLFAGSGALGLEALSRGAAHCTFVEQDSQALEALRTNAARLGALPRADIRAQSVMTLAPSAAPFDLLLLDPPYGTGAGSVALDRLSRIGWLSPSSAISVESASPETISVRGWAVETERRYGKTKISLLRAETER